MARRTTTGSGSAPYVPRAQDVARELRDAIHAGRYRAGQPIRQEAVAQQLGVSRIPVREALLHLQAEGLVVIRPHSGARVVWVDHEELEAIYKIRERLEPLALSESAGRLSDEQLAEIAARAQALERLGGDPEAWLEGDRELHLACYAGVTPRLLEMIVGLWNATQRYGRLLVAGFSEEDFAVQHSEHRLIADALATGNARAGEALVRAHVERARLRLARDRSLLSP